MRRSALTLLLVAGLLGGCSEKYGDNTNGLVYTQDVRTGLCFAWFGTSAAKNLTFSVVPCSPEVLALVRQPAQ